MYFAQPVSQQHLTNKMVVDRIVRETSLSAGDVSNALISLGAIVRDGLELGQSVDLADLGSFRIIVPAKIYATLRESWQSSFYKRTTKRGSSNRKNVRSMKFTTILLGNKKNKLGFSQKKSMTLFTFFLIYKM